MFFKSSKDKEKIALEDKIIGFMRKADSLKEEQPKLAYRFITQATRLYHEELNGYSKRIDKEFSQIFMNFIDMYSPVIKPNPKLV